MKKTNRQKSMDAVWKYTGLWMMSLAFIITGCKTDPKIDTKTEVAPSVARKIPKFEVDSAYAHVENQVNFGVRYPGSPGHKAVVDYIAAEAEQYADKVIRQNFKASFFDVKNADATNIIAVFNPQLSKRVLLCAHFDTRMIAEKDIAEGKRKEAILGADDGASGVGVLLEIARLVKENGLDIGVDMVFFDAEDNGNNQEGWCLGAKYWSKNPHVAGYKAEFGILLDMVGAKNAEFGREAYSQTYAGTYLDKIWALAERMGYGNYFLNFDAGGIEDDHVYVIKNLGIPTVDIINRQRNVHESGFGLHHHTHDDNLEIIDKNTLRSVGKVVTAVVYNVSNRTF